MLGLDACELGAQLLELLRLALCARGERRSRAAATCAGGSKGAARLGVSPRGNFGARGDLVACMYSGRAWDFSPRRPFWGREPGGKECVQPGGCGLSRRWGWGFFR